MQDVSRLEGRGIPQRNHALVVRDAAFAAPHHEGLGLAFSLTTQALGLLSSTP